MTAVLATQELVSVYADGTRAVDGVDLSVGRAELVAIVGQNGSGKSTLVRNLNGLLRPTTGRVLIEGRDAGQLRVAHIARTVGLVFQDPDRQIFAGSVRAEAAFGARNAGVRGDELERTVRDALASVGLDGRESTNPYDLGYSKRKLLALASVLAMRTPVVVLDEPTTGQDARGIALLQTLIARLQREGRTVIAISHDMRFVAETFGRVVVMRAGRIVLDGAPAEVFDAANWPLLDTTHLEPTFPARVGARLGLGSTPTDADVVAGLAGRA